MEKDSGHSEFMKTVHEIKVAEEEYDHLLLDAKEKADGILRKAKEQIAKEKSKAQEAATAFKNEKLKEGNEEIESEVNELLKKAGAKSVILRKSTADKNFVKSLIEVLLTEQ